LVIILAIVLLLFGAPKLPGLARSIGQSARILRSEVKTPTDATDAAATDDDASVEPGTAASEAKPASAQPSDAKASSSTPPTTPKS
jgi:sec-independent protein translocase protein TatA